MTMLYDCRDAFASTLIELAREEPRIVVLSNDSIGSSKLTHFAREFPSRLINVGIAEQNLVGIAAGLENGGKIPVVCSATCFLTSRALEQIKVDVAYSERNVKLCGMSSGVAYGALGPTHHSIEDYAWTRAIANMTVIAPADPNETQQALRAALRFVGPVFLRLSRMPVPIVHQNGYRFQIGRAARLKEGRDVTLISNGVMVTRALDAARLLSEAGYEATVLNMATVRPLDRFAVIDAATRTGAIVTVEEHTIFGGLGGAVAEITAAECPVPMRILGVPGVFAPVGSAEFILDHFGLTAAGIRDAAIDLIRGKARSRYGR